MKGFLAVLGFLAVVFVVTAVALIVTGLKSVKASNANPLAEIEFKEHLYIISNKNYQYFIHSPGCKCLQSAEAYEH